MQQYILYAISASEEKKQTKKIRLIQFSKYASAACAVLLLGFALFLGLNNVGNPQIHRTVIANVKAKSLLSQPSWKKVNNKTTQIVRYLLPDASMVWLYPGGTIRFNKTFDQKYRNVYLKGKAKFKVKRDTLRPFSVYSGILKTTALGTSFTINTTGANISVKLHTGKIMVSHVKSDRKLAYISTVGTTLVYHANSAKIKILEAEKPIRVASEFIKHEGSLITMKNIPLSKVFGLLYDAYGVNISTDQKEINTITFTGKVDTAKEQAEDILKIICLINNMTFTQTSETEFFIIKSN